MLMGWNNTDVKKIEMLIKKLFVIKMIKKIKQTIKNHKYENNKKIQKKRIYRKRLKNKNKNI